MSSRQHAEISSTHSGGIDLAQTGSPWLARALNRGGVGLWRWEPGEDRLSYTDNLPALLGRDDIPFEPRLDGLLAAIRSEDRDIVRKTFEETARVGHDFRIEFRTVRDTWIEATGSAVREGDRSFLEGAMLDVTARVHAEREVVDTHAKYQRAIGGTGMAVYQLDFQSDEYLNTNLEVLEKIVGAPYEGSHRQQWKGIKSLDRRFHGELAGVEMGEAARRYRTGEVANWCYESKVQTSDGQVRWLYDMATQVYDADGNITGSFGILQDVTEFRRLSTVLEQILESTATTGEDYLQRLVVSLSKSLGVKLAFVGKTRPGTDDQIDTVAFAINGEVVANVTYDLKDTPCEGVTRGEICFHRSGVQEAFPEDKFLGEMNVQAYLGMPLRDSANEPLGILVVLHDRIIDESLDPVKVLRLFASHAAAYLERQRSAQALRRSEELYRSLFEVLQEGIIIKDRNWVVEACNAAAEAILRLPQKDVLGKTTDELGIVFFQPGATISDAPRLVTSEDICTGGVQVGSTCGLRHPDGTVTWISINALPIRNGLSDEKKLVVSFTDITARREAEESLRHLNSELETVVQERTRDLQNANKELESFAYSVSHDLRQPLRAIDGFARILELDYGTLLDEEAHRHLGKIRSASVRMARLIDDLLRLSRLFSHEIRPTQIDMSKLAADVLSTLVRTDEGRSFEFHVEDNLSAKGDESLMRAVLDNLLNNSVKFTSRREMAEIRFGRRDGAFFVQDNGEGFDMRYSDKLFEPFQRLHSHDEFEGTGIGLATVRRIVERHGGRVWAESEVGKGATFYFTLP